MIKVGAILALPSGRWRVIAIRRRPPGGRLPLARGHVPYTTVGDRTLMLAPVAAGEIGKNPATPETPDYVLK